MKNKKTFFRLLAGLCCVALCGILITGCGKDAGTQTDESESSQGGTTEVVSSQGTDESEDGVNNATESIDGTEDVDETEEVDTTEEVETTEEIEETESEGRLELPDEAEGVLKEEEEILKITPTNDKVNNGTGSNDKEVYKAPDAATAKNPIVKVANGTLPATFSSGKIPAEKSLCYKLTAKKGSYISIEDENAYIVYGGTKYSAKEGKLLFKLQEEVSTIEIGNKSGTEKKFAVSIIAASVVDATGTKDNPEKIEAITTDGTVIEKKLDAGDKDGYYYVWTAKRDAMVDFTVTTASAKNLAYDLVVTVNEEVKSIQENGVANEEGTTLTTSVLVAKGDIVSIQLIAKKVADDTYPAVDKASFTARCILYGSEEYPVVLALEQIPGEIKVDVPAGEKIYCNSGIIGGAELSIESATANVIYKEQTYSPVENKVSLKFDETSGGKEPIHFIIQNTGTTDETYTLVFNKEYPEGSFDNPMKIEANDELKSHIFAEGDDYYYYQWTAVETTTVMFDISSTTEVGWQYSIGKGEDDNEAITHFSNDETLVLTETHEVEAGATLIIKVATFASAELPTPAGTINFKLSVIEKVDTTVAVAPIPVKPEDGTDMKESDESTEIVADTEVAESTEVVEEVKNTESTEIPETTDVVEETAVPETTEVVEETEVLEVPEALEETDVLETSEVVDDTTEKVKDLKVLEPIALRLIRNWCIRLFCR